MEGAFTLEAGEQAGTGLPGQVRIRRRACEAACWEYFSQQSVDGRLRDLDRLLKPALAELVADGLAPAGTLRADLLAAVTAHAATVPQVEQRRPLPKDLQARLLAFSGKDESPDDAVRTALNSCYVARSSWIWSVSSPSWTGAIVVATCTTTSGSSDVHVSVKWVR